MLGNFLKFLQCLKIGIKRRNENKFHKFIWLGGEEKKINFKVLQCKTV